MIRKTFGFSFISFSTRKTPVGGHLKMLYSSLLKMGDVSKMAMSSAWLDNAEKEYENNKLASQSSAIRWQC